jgi:hypothetical protein
MTRKQRWSYLSSAKTRTSQYMIRSPGRCGVPGTRRIPLHRPTAGSSAARAQPAAGLSLVAAAALAVWLLTANSSSDTRPSALISNTTAPQQAVLVSSQASTGGYASPLDPIRSVLPEQPNPVRFGDARSAARHRLCPVLPEQPDAVHNCET